LNYANTIWDDLKIIVLLQQDSAVELFEVYNP